MTKSVPEVFLRLRVTLSQKTIVLSKLLQRLDGRCSVGPLNVATDDLEDAVDVGAGEAR